MGNVKNIAISILDAEDKNDTLKKIYDASMKIAQMKFENCFNSIIHLDVMDNKFVPNTGIDLECILAAKKYNFFTDLHLMVESPIDDGFIDKALEYGVDSITVHYEINDFENVIKYLSSKNVEVGVAVKPDTDISLLKQYEEYFDKILIMTVEPGFGGQKYINKCNEKIKLAATSMFKDKKIEIDGGVNEETIKFGLRNNVNTFVLGNAFIHSDDYYETLLKFNIIKDIEELFSKSNTKDLILAIREISKKYVNIGCDFEIVSFLMNSKYEEYRSLGNFMISEIVEQNKENKELLGKIKENLPNTF